MKRSASLVAAITSTAIFLAEGRTPDEIGMLGSILTQLGDTLSTIGLNEALEKASAADTSTTQRQTAKSEAPYSAKSASKAPSEKRTRLT